MSDTTEQTRPRRRGLVAAAAVVAAFVAVFFATLGDGSDAQADGVRGVVLEHGHTATWVLLAVALGLTAWGRGPRGLPRAIGLVGLACYVVFLATLLTTPQT